MLFSVKRNFMRTGMYYAYRFDGGYTESRITSSYWWSSTNSSATTSHYLGVHSSGVTPQHGYFRGEGIAIRCTIRVE